jgi:hypothetical protein
MTPPVFPDDELRGRLGKLRGHGGTRFGRVAARCGLPSTRPIDFSPSPFCQRSQSSGLCAGVNPTRMYFFLIAITPPPIVKVKCCLDPLNPPLPYARRSSASAVAFSSSERRGLPSRTLSNDLRISATAAGTFALAVALSAVPRYFSTVFPNRHCSGFGTPTCTRYRPRRCRRYGIWPLPLYWRRCFPTGEWLPSGIIGPFVRTGPGWLGGVKIPLILAHNFSPNHQIYITISMA